MTVLEKYRLGTGGGHKKDLRQSGKRIKDSAGAKRYSIGRGVEEKQKTKHVTERRRQNPGKIDNHPSRFISSSGGLASGGAPQRDNPPFPL